VLVFLGLVVVAGGSVAGGTVPGGTMARAGVTPDARKPLPRVVLHPKWRRLAPGGIALVAVSGRYVYIGRWTGSASVIDEETKHAVRLNPPAGCFFDTERAPLGGLWVIARCRSGPDALWLYSIPGAKWTRFSPNTAQMCALNHDCATGTARAQCSADYTAIGKRWIEFAFGCGYHSGTVTDALQNIRSRQVKVAPAGLQGGGTEIVDLNSPTGTRRLCAPLQVPTDGKIVPDGRFAVAESNLDDNVFLERCGSHSRAMIGRGLFSVNSRAVLMSVGLTSNEIDGVFLPSRRRFGFRLPRQLASVCGREATFVCIQGLALTHHTVYVLTDRAQLWIASSPTLPTPAVR
jgi:hypothetical protein